ncbi:MAG: lipase family alpha/beta hydrolase [Bradymonadaceae bacterium]
MRRVETAQLSGRWAAVVAALLSVSCTVGCSNDGFVPGPGGMDADGTAGGRSDAAPDGRLADVAAEVGAPDAGTADAGPEGPYPVVLAHGMGGFEHLTEADQLSYFYEVERALERAGETVFVTEVAPFASSKRRGEQLLRQIEKIVGGHPADRVNVIAHSQGGIDARYAAHERPDLIASVVTISSPNRGVVLADVVLGLIDYPLLREVVDGLIRIFGAPVYEKAGADATLIEPLREISTDAMEKFNGKYHNRDGVWYGSIAGRSDGHLGRKVCDPFDSPPFVRKWRWTRDPVDPLFRATERLADGIGADDRYPNDGLVRVSEAKWGHFLGCIPADHYDEVGQLAGDAPGGDNDWDYLAFYRKLVAYLHDRGL